MASQQYATASMPPLHQQMESLQRGEGRYKTSSYENVYDGVPLDPKINRMSGDASELDIGDRFDTKQKEQLEVSDRSSSYEKIYEKEAKEIIGESDQTKTSHASFSSRHACPIYITVEEGLDKLSAEEANSNIFKEFKERSLSCESQLEVDHQEDLRYRHNSSPDMSVFTPSTYLNEFSRGRVTSLCTKCPSFQLSLCFNESSMCLLSLFLIGGHTLIINLFWHLGRVGILILRHDNFNFLFLVAHLIFLINFI